MTRIEARLDAIGVLVTDLAAARAFYRLLGVDVPEGEGHVEAALPGGLRLMFDTEDVVRSFSPGFVPPTGAGRVSLAFLLPDPAGVDAAHAAVVAAGHRSELAPFDAVWGQRYAVVLDPDGNEVGLFAPLAS